MKLRLGDKVMLTSCAWDEHNKIRNAYPHCYFCRRMFWLGVIIYEQHTGMTAVQIRWVNSPDEDPIWLNPKQVVKCEEDTC